MMQAQQLDREDPLAHFRSQFHIPILNSKEALYFAGNSLGLQPKRTAEYVNQALQDWAQLGVKGHMDAKYPWLPYHEFVANGLAEIVGAKSHEVVAMNALTVNLHLLMISFYRPTQKRHKILIEHGSFPSDRYAVCSQIMMHGYSVADSLIEIQARPGEDNIRHEDIIDRIAAEGEHIALILFGGVNYYTGQVFDMAAITRAGHDQGCVVGFDLAHAVGNVLLQLHKWQVDFAVWCHYKYINGGPGTIGGAYVYEKHCQDESIPRLNGWWGHDKQSRFTMPKDFRAIGTAESWQLSNPPILQLAALRAAIELFQQAAMAKLREKSIKLTGFLYDCVRQLPESKVRVLTPREANERGCQLSLTWPNEHPDPLAALEGYGVVCDYRKPGVIRVAPTPLYNRYQDIVSFVEILKELL